MRFFLTSYVSIYYPLVSAGAMCAVVGVFTPITTVFAAILNVFFSITTVFAAIPNVFFSIAAIF